MHKYRQRVKQHYTDEQRAEALTLVELRGGPDVHAAIVAVANELSIPESTLRDWAMSAQNPVSVDLRLNQRREFTEVITDELEKIFEQLKTKRDSASYRDLGIVAGILFDKLQLLQGMPTSITEHTHVFSEADRESAIKGYLDIAAQRKQGGMPPSDPLISDVAHKGVLGDVVTSPTPTLPPPQQGTSVSTDSGTLTGHGDVIDITVVNPDLHKLSDDAP